MLENQNRSATQTPPTQQKSHWLPTLITLGIIAIGGVLVWYVTYSSRIERSENHVLENAFDNDRQTQENSEIDTKNWKTYRSQKFGFSLNHPNNWEAYALSGGIQLASYKPEVLGRADGIVIVKVPIYSGTNLQDIYKGGESGYGVWDLQKDCKKINFAQTDTYDCVSLDDGTPKRSLLIVHGITLFQINDYEQTGITDQILSTFKLIESAQADTTQLKIYRNEDFGFEFQYPAKFGTISYSKDIVNPGQETEGECKGQGYTLGGSTELFRFASVSPDYKICLGRGGALLDYVRFEVMDDQIRLYL